MTDEEMTNVSKSITDLDAFRESLQRVTSQLEAIRSSFYQGVEEIERIKKVLDAEHISRFSDIITEFEDRLSKIERERDEAIENAKRFSQELEKEKERLIKLWDAYKLQEDELAEKEKRINELEDKIKEYEKKINEIETDLKERIETLS